jgi:(2Fe-2S) ferredoxin
MVKFESIMEIGSNIYDLHLFVCTNQRELPKSGCGDLGSMDLVATLKKELKSRNVDKKIRINKSGCLDVCEQGPAMVLYPEGKWFFNVTPQNIPYILDEILKTN